jgi:hypothetical protein
VKLTKVTSYSALVVCLFSLNPAIHAATITIAASGAKNVSDYEFDPVTGTILYDGLGDEVATDPYPRLGAGIFLAGASGQNGTARFQMEFSLAGVSLPIVSAFLVLNSDPSPNNTLDTTFFHVTTDEDGVITADDFQSAAASTGIVQSAVLAPAEYSYDVTTFVRNDLMAGFLFTSYQGRVDEGAGIAFLRGLEYASNAVAADLRPRLLIETAEIPEPGTSLLLCLGAGLALAGRRFRVSRA